MGGLSRWRVSSVLLDARCLWLKSRTISLVGQPPLGASVLVPSCAHHLTREVAHASVAGSYWHPCCLFDNPPRCVAQLEPVCLTLLPHRDGRCHYFLFEMPCGLPPFRVTLKCPGTGAWWWHYAAMHAPSSMVPARHCAWQRACPSVVPWRMLRRLDLSSWGVVRQWVRWAAKQHACLPHIPCCFCCG